MRYGLITVLVSLLAGLITPVFAQQQIFKNYTVNDGLISNSVRRIFQDSKGFLWIATVEGLSMYDGYTFTNYSMANGLSHNLVNDFYESKDGQLYIALNNGAIDMISYNKIIPKAVPSTAAVNRFIHTSQQQVIVTTDDKGLQEFSDGKLIQQRKTFLPYTYSDLIWLNDSLFMAVTDSSIEVFNRRYELFAENKARYAKYTGSKIYQDSKKRIWVATYDGLNLLAGFPQKNRPITFSPLSAPFNIPALQRNKINDIFEDAGGTMWFGTIGGLVKVSPDGSHQLITVKDGLSSNIINSIFQDKEKNIWFGTAVGLSKLVTQSGIRLYPLENGVWSNDNLFLLHPFKKYHLLVGTLNGAQVFNKLTGRFSPVANGDNQIFYNVVSNSKPTLFIGVHNMATFDSIASQYDKILPLPMKPAGRIVSDSQHNFFLSDAKHLFFIAGRSHQKILDYRISSLLIDKNGCLWAGTWQNGLYRIRYSYVDNKFHLLAKDHFLPNENIRTLFEGSMGNIWVGTRFQGVYQLINNGKDNFTISNFGQSKGLTSNFIKAIKEDAHGNLWIAFYQGLDKLIRQGNSFRVFNFSRVNNYFASIVGMEIDEDRSLWLATNEGLAHITDGEFEKLPPLPVYITKVSSPDSTYLLNEKKIQLSHRQNQVQFEFSSPGFINEKQVLYSYRLLDSDNKEWSVVGNQHVVSYASLQPGSYIFEVRTLGWNGNWGKPASFEFIITPPFWQTWWFISIISFCILLLVYLFMKWREKNIKTIAEEKLKVQQLDAGQYKSKLEMELIINYFSSSLLGKNTEDAVLWDVANNLIGRLGFVDCMIYLWNADKTKMIQKAGFGPKGSIEEINNQPFDVVAGQGVVGYVMQTKEAVLIPDTTKDLRYRPDEMTRLSEITVPVIYNDELIGVIDSEHHERNFFNRQHLHIISTIATLMANKIESINAERSLQQTTIEMYNMNEQLSKAKLEALRSQMNPHFIFNCINSIDALIQSNDKYHATVYLNKFARLIRDILDSSKKDTVTLAKDLDTLKLYIELEQLRDETKFTAEIKADDDLLQDDYKVPPLIIQPFVENAILHGLKNKDGKEGILIIDIKKVNDKIQYIITDNGIGRKAAGKIRQNKESHYGMQMSYDRIKLFNKEETASVQVTDLYNNENPEGTEVKVNLNII